MAQVKKPLKVLSLFDGMSCGRIALHRSGIPVAKYFASEIDKHAMAVSGANWPDIIQLGNVIDINTSKLPKIDLLIGGSPCQSFSFSGKRQGMITADNVEILTLDHYLDLKNEGFKFQGQSYLFWEFINIYNQVKPAHFLLENVPMEQKWKNLISATLGVNPIEFNSKLVSAQNRERLFWTNIGMQPAGLFGYPESIIPQPKDRHIYIKDIVEKEVDQKCFLSAKRLATILKSNRSGKQIDIYTPKAGTLIAGYNKIPTDAQYFRVHNAMPRSSKTGKGGSGPLSRTDGKTYCLDTQQSNVVEIIGSVKYGRTQEAKELRKKNRAKGKDTSPFAAKEIVGIDTEKMNTLTTAATKNNLLFTQNYIQWDSSGKGHKSQQDRAYFDTSKSNALHACPPYDKTNVFINNTIRRLTPLECERLQTVPDNYTNHVSDTQRYKMLGNGWTIDIIAHILKHL